MVVMKELTAEAAECVGSIGTLWATVADTSASTNRQTVDADKEDLIWDGFDKRTVIIQTQITPLKAAMLEVRQYLEGPNISRRDDPLAWWNARVKVYPRLAKLATCNLRMVATSVPSEILIQVRTVGL